MARLRSCSPADHVCLHYDPTRQFKIGGGPVVLPPSPLTHQPACKPGSVWSAANRRRDSHSSCTPVARRIKQPTRITGLDRPETCASTSFLFGLAPGGVCRAVSVAGNAVRSYRTVSPLPRLNATRRGGLFSVALSLEPVPAKGICPAGRYPAPLVHGARTFLPGHLSALARSGRPAD